jgi:hypothetical protein
MTVKSEMDVRTARLKRLSATWILTSLGDLQSTRGDIQSPLSDGAGRLTGAIDDQARNKVPTRTDPLLDLIHSRNDELDYRLDDLLVDPIADFLEGIGECSPALPGSRGEESTGVGSRRDD